MQFRLILEEKTELLNRRGISNLPLWKTLAIYQKSQEPSFWEVMDMQGCQLQELFSNDY